jgi:quercetin dioxygenase-like cupin family protein
MKKFSWLAVLGFVSTLAWAQDPVAVDPAHYSVEFENDSVRVLRIAYGPGEKSVMHYHPAGVAVFLTDQDVVFTFPDGTSTAAPSTGAGGTIWTPAGQHLPENVGSEPLEVILVEVKATDETD